MRTPPKASTVVYPFAFIKPCGVLGDTTLKDVNQRIHNPPKPKPEEEDDPAAVSYPTSAFSGKPVVGKTKIHTEGGKGSITIMRTKGWTGKCSLVVSHESRGTTAAAAGSSPSSPHCTFVCMIRLFSQAFPPPLFRGKLLVFIWKIIYLLELLWTLNRKDRHECINIFTFLHAAKIIISFSFHSFSDNKLVLMSNLYYLKCVILFLVKDFLFFALC